MNGKHDKDCPLYEEDVDLFQIWNVRIWMDVLANSTTRIARFMKSRIWRKNVCIWLAAWTGKTDPDCPCYKEADPLMLASGVQVADAIYLDANAGNDLNDGKSNDTAVQTLEKAYELAEDGDTIYLLSVLNRQQR